MAIKRAQQRNDKISMGDLRGRVIEIFVQAECKPCDFGALVAFVSDWLKAANKASAESR